MSTAELIGGANTMLVNVDCKLTRFPHDEVLECRAYLCPEEEGGFSIHCINLAGVMSQGDDESEAIENIKDAFRETVNYYRDSGKPVPWLTGKAEQFAGGREFCILVKLG